MSKMKSGGAKKMQKGGEAKPFVGSTKTIIKGGSGDTTRKASGAGKATMKKGGSVKKK